MTSIVRATLHDIKLLTILGKKTFIESHGMSASKADIDVYTHLKFTNEVFENDVTAWSRNASSPFDCSLSEPAESTIYPVLGNNVILATGDSNKTKHIMTLNHNDSGTESITELGDDESFIFCVYICS